MKTMRTSIVRYGHGTSVAGLAALIFVPMMVMKDMLIMYSAATTCFRDPPPMACAWLAVLAPWSTYVALALSVALAHWIIGKAIKDAT